MVVVEDDLERGEQPRLEVDLVVGGDDRHGQRTQREEPERDQRRQEHGARELGLRLIELRGMYGVYLDAGEEQQYPGQECDVAHARDVREEARMHVVRRVDIDDLADGVGDVLQCDGVASGHPDDGHDDYDDAGKHRADQEPFARNARYGRGAAQRDQRGAPVHGDREKPHEKSVLRQAGHPDHIGDRGCGKAQHGGVPYDVLDPLQEDGRKPQVFVERLLDPGVDSAALRGEGASQFGPYQRRRDQEQERGEKDVEEHRQLLLRHHRESAQADNRRRGHQGKLCRRDIFTFCHNVELCFTTGRQSVSMPQRGRADVFSGVCMVYAGVSAPRGPRSACVLTACGRGAKKQQGISRLPAAFRRIALLKLLTQT